MVFPSGETTFCENAFRAGKIKITSKKYEMFLVIAAGKSQCKRILYFNILPLFLDEFIKFYYLAKVIEILSIAALS